MEQLSVLHGLRELNLNYVAGIRDLRGMASLTHLHTLHVGYSDVDRVYLHQLSTNLPQLLSLDVAWSRVSTLLTLRGTFLSCASKEDNTALTPRHGLSLWRLLGSSLVTAILKCGLLEPYPLTRLTRQAPHLRQRHWRQFEM